MDAPQWLNELRDDRRRGAVPFGNLTDAQIREKLGRCLDHIKALDEQLAKDRAHPDLPAPGPGPKRKEKATAPSPEPDAPPAE